MPIPKGLGDKKMSQQEKVELIREQVKKIERRQEVQKHKIRAKHLEEQQFLFTEQQRANRVKRGHVPRNHNASLMEVGDHLHDGMSERTLSPGSAMRRLEMDQRPPGFKQSVPFDPDLIYTGKINKKVIDQQKAEQMIKAECAGLSQKMRLLDALVDD